MAFRIYVFMLIFNIKLCSIVIAKPVSPDALLATEPAVQKNDHNLTTTTERITTESKKLTTRLASNKRLDLVFIMDSTGSMTSYIDNVRKQITYLVDEIGSNSGTDLRLALIEYRDHVPQEKTFVTREHNFTDSVETMKTWLNKTQASGGGDGPEAVADALHQVTKLTWRNDSAKISVLISDAPPHGLVPWEDRSFPNGSPNGYDPVDIVRELAKREITLYAVGCEPSIIPYKDFFMALAYLTGGQYIPLSDSRRLIDAITGGAQEVLSLQKFSKDVEQEIKRVQDAGELVNEQSIAESVYNKLKGEGATATHLLRNDKPIEEASIEAKVIAAAYSMADVRKTFKKGDDPRSSIEVSGIYMDSSVYPTETYDKGGASFRSFGAGKTSLSSKPELPTASLIAEEAYSAVESAVSLEQISRLVKNKAAKLSL